MASVQLGFCRPTFITQQILSMLVSYLFEPHLVHKQWKKTYKPRNLLSAGIENHKVHDVALSALLLFQYRGFVFNTESALKIFKLHRNAFLRFLHCAPYTCGGTAAPASAKP